MENGLDSVERRPRDDRLMRRLIALPEPAKLAPKSGSLRRCRPCLDIWTESDPNRPTPYNGENPLALCSWLQAHVWVHTRSYRFSAPAEWARYIEPTIRN